MYFGEYMKKKIERSAFLSLINLQSQSNSPLSKNTYNVDSLKLEKHKKDKKKKKNRVSNRKNSSAILKNSHEYLDNSSVSFSEKLFLPSSSSLSPSLKKRENVSHEKKYCNENKSMRNQTEAEYAQSRSYVDVSTEQEKNKHIRIINYEKFEEALKSIQHKKYFKNFQSKNKENSKNSKKKFEKFARITEKSNNILLNTESNKRRDNTYDKLKKELKMVSQINKITQERKKEKEKFIDRIKRDAKKQSNESSIVSKSRLSSKKLEHDNKDNLYEKILNNYNNHLNGEVDTNATSRNDMNYKYSSIEGRESYLGINYDSNKKEKNILESSIQLDMEKNEKEKDPPIQQTQRKNTTAANYVKEKKKKVLYDRDAEDVYETEKSRSDLCDYNTTNMIIQESGEHGNDVQKKKQETIEASQEVHHNESNQQKNKLTEQTHSKETNREKQIQNESEEQNLKVYTKFLFLSNTSESDKDAKEKETKESDVVKKNIEENMKNEKLMKAIHTNSGKLCFKNKIDKSEIGTMEETIDPSQESKDEKLERKKEHTKDSVPVKRKITLEKNYNKDYELSTNYNVVSTQYTSCNEQVVQPEMEEKEQLIIQEKNKEIEPMYERIYIKDQMELNEKKIQYYENRENEFNEKRVDISLSNEFTLYGKNKMDTNEKYEKQDTLRNEDKNKDKSYDTGKEELKVMNSSISSYQKENGFLNNCYLKENYKINNLKSDDHSLNDSNQCVKKENGIVGNNYKRMFVDSFKTNDDAYTTVNAKDIYKMNIQDKERILPIREHFSLEEKYNTTTNTTTTTGKIKSKERKIPQVNLYEHSENISFCLSQTKYEDIKTRLNETEKISRLVKKEKSEYHEVKNKINNFNNNTHILESINFKNVYLEYTNGRYNNNVKDNKGDRNPQNIKTNKRYTSVDSKEKPRIFEYSHTPINNQKDQEEIMYKHKGNEILEKAEKKKYSTLVNIGNNNNRMCKEQFNDISMEMKSEEQSKVKEEINNPFEELFMLLEKKKKKKVLKKIEEIIESNKGMNDTISDENLLKELQRLYRRKKHRKGEKKENEITIRTGNNISTRGLKNVTTKPIIIETKKNDTNNEMKESMNRIQYSKMNERKKETIFEDGFVFKMGDTLNLERTEECSGERKQKKSDWKSKKIKKKKIEEGEEEEPPFFIFKKEKLLEDETTLLNLFELYEKCRKEEKKNKSDKKKDKEKYAHRENAKTNSINYNTFKFEKKYIHDYEKESNALNHEESDAQKCESKDNKQQESKEIPKNSTCNQENNTNKFRISYKFDLFDVYEKYCKIKNEKKKKNLFSHYTSINLQEEVSKIQKLNGRNMNSNFSLKEIKSNETRIKSESEKEKIEDKKIDSYQTIEEHEEKDNKEKEEIHNIEILSEVEQDWKLKSASITSLGRPTTRSLRSNVSNLCSNFSSNHDIEPKHDYISNEVFSMNNTNGIKPKEYKNENHTHTQDNSFDDPEHSLNYSASDSFIRSNDIIETQGPNKQNNFFVRNREKSFEKYNIHHNETQHGRKTKKWGSKQWKNKLRRNANKERRRKPFDSNKINKTQKNSKNLRNLESLNKNKNKNICNGNLDYGEKKDSLANLDSLTNYVLHMIESYYE